MKTFKQYITEVAPPGDKAERMVKNIKKGYAKDGVLTKKEKGIAYATAWKAHNKGQVKEDGAVASGSVGPTNVTGPQSGTDPISATAVRPNKKKKYLMGIRRNLPNV